MQAFFLTWFCLLPRVDEHTDSSKTCIEGLFKHYDLWIHHDSDCFLGGGSGVSSCRISRPCTTQMILTDDVTVALSWDSLMVELLA